MRVHRSKHTRTHTLQNEEPIWLFLFFEPKLKNMTPFWFPVGTPWGQQPCPSSFTVTLWSYRAINGGLVLVTETHILHEGTWPSSLFEEPNHKHGPWWLPALCFYGTTHGWAVPLPLVGTRLGIQHAGKRFSLLLAPLLLEQGLWLGTESLCLKDDVRNIACGKQ